MPVIQWPGIQRIYYTPALARRIKSAAGSALELTSTRAFTMDRILRPLTWVAALECDGRTWRGEIRAGTDNSIYVSTEGAPNFCPAAE